MRGVLGLTVTLETTDWVGDTKVREGRWVISVEVRDRYLPDEGGDCDMRVKGRVLDAGELDRDDCTEDDRGEEDMGVDEREGGCWINGSDWMGTSHRLALSAIIGGFAGGTLRGEGRVSHQRTALN